MVKWIKTTTAEGRRDRAGFVSPSGETEREKNESLDKRERELEDVERLTEWRKGNRLLPVSARKSYADVGETPPKT